MHSIAGGLITALDRLATSQAVSLFYNLSFLLCWILQLQGAAIGSKFFWSMHLGPSGVRTCMSTSMRELPAGSVGVRAAAIV
jgi:hypothetical protein